MHFLRRFVNGNYYHTVFELLPVHAGQRVLEVGCGMGDACEVLPPGVEYLGIDVSEPCLDYARRIHGRPGVAFSDRPLSECEGGFDCALVICTLHHLSLEQGQELARELRRLVNGPLLVAEPDAERSNLLQRYILSRDRGDYPLRPISGHLELLAQHYECEQMLTQDLRLALARLTYSVCRPR